MQHVITHEHDESFALVEAHTLLLLLSSMDLMKTFPKALSPQRS